MCCICGWFSTSKNIDFYVLERMNNIASYRGPDDEGYSAISRNGMFCYRGDDSCIKDIPHISELYERNNDYYIAFAHRRLSILDLSVAGHQPMNSPDDKLCITFNGEIYNYIEIRDELKKRGYMFRSSCDTEVILAAYQEWGESCVHHFNGMWSFVIWDKDNNKLFCSRDRLGAKPFHYYVDNDNFVFGSEMKQICQNPLVSKVLNEKLLVRQITWGITDYSEESLIEAIKILPGGFNLTIKYRIEDPSANRIKIIDIKKNQYWDIDTYRKDSSVENELFALHENAVQIRTRSDVPIGVLLSGGLDSSALVAEISEYYRSKGEDTKQINTFTSCYSNFDEGDERYFAELTNEFCKVTGNMIYPDESDTFSLYRDMIWHLEGRAEIGSLGAYMLLRDISKFGIKVMINGQGSDETMLGYERYYGWYLKDVLKNEGLKHFKDALCEAVRNSKLSKRELAAYYLYFNNYHIRKARTIFRFKTVSSQYSLARMKRDKDVRKYLSFNTMPELQYNEIRKTQLTHILRGDDRMYMAYSMESRVPFIDYRYIEQAVRLPEKNKIVDGFTKYPLRKHIEGRLPSEVVWRKNKMGWPSPRDRWIERFEDDRVRELFIDSRCSKIFDINKVMRLYKKDPKAHGIEQFINTELFMRLFDVNCK